MSKYKESENYIKDKDYLLKIKNSDITKEELEDLEKHYKIKEISKTNLTLTDCDCRNGFYSKFYLRGFMEDIFDITQEYPVECSNMTLVKPWIYEISIEPNYVDSKIEISKLLEEYPFIKAVGFFGCNRTVYEVFSETGYPYITSRIMAGDFLDDFNWFNEYSVFDDINYNGIDVRTSQRFYVRHSFYHKNSWNEIDFVFELNNKLIQIQAKDGT